MLVREEDAQEIGLLKEFDARPRLAAVLRAQQQPAESHDDRALRVRTDERRARQREAQTFGQLVSLPSRAAVARHEHRARRADCDARLLVAERDRIKVSAHAGLLLAPRPPAVFGRDDAAVSSDGPPVLRAFTGERHRQQVIPHARLPEIPDLPAVFGRHHLAARADRDGDLLIFDE